jgi:hypothetical protein
VLSARSLTLKPSDLGRTVEVTGEDGAPLATYARGELRAASGEPILRVTVNEPSGARRDRPAEAFLEVADAQGLALGTVRIVKYGFGPRAKKLTLALLGGDGAELGRIEPADDRGERLIATTSGSEAAAVAVEQVKIGFLRKARVYTATFPASPDLLVLGALVGYEALLSAAMAASMRD